MSLPPLDGRTESVALTDTDGTRLGRAVAARCFAHPGKAGIHALPDPHDAFAARAILSEVAERSLDVQYYIWHADQTGYLMFECLWRAADRGVRVRLLLDDLTTSGLDDTIAPLDAHPNIEVRLYNPFAHRRARWLDFLGDFSRVHRRMHNKSFTADVQASIVGGRNVGNEYFGAGDGVLFTDLDVLAVGPVADEVSNAFDLYWNSPSAYPAATILGDAKPETVASLKARFAATRADPESRVYLEALQQTTLARQLLDGEVEFEWTVARLLFDNPAKTLDRSERIDVLLLLALLREGSRPKNAIDLISPYFVPGDDAAAELAAFSGRGAKVRVLTNSLAATDVGAVHAGYARHRAALLGSGIELFELKPALLDASRKHGGSSSASLHAKTFAYDGRHVFVGSFNYDRRSARLNTEMGLLMDSPVLATRVADAFTKLASERAYEVRLAPDGKALEWIERTPSGEIHHETEPGTGPLRRAWIGFLSTLPIDWLL